MKFANGSKTGFVVVAAFALLISWTMLSLRADGNTTSPIVPEAAASDQ